MQCFSEFSSSSTYPHPCSCLGPSPWERTAAAVPLHWLRIRTEIQEHSMFLTLRAGMKNLKICLKHKPPNHWLLLSPSPHSPTSSFCTVPYHHEAHESHCPRCHHATSHRFLSQELLESRVLTTRSRTLPSRQPAYHSFTLYINHWQQHVIT